MPEENLADIVSSKEGDNPFEDVKEEKETPTDSPPEEKTKEEESPPSQGEPDEPEGESEPKEESKKDNTEKEKQIPFHKHPRWKERENQWNEKFEELERKSEERLQEVLKVKEPKNIPNWFKGLYGEDQTQMWDEYSSLRKAEREELKQEILDEQRGEQEATISKQNEEVKRWNDWIDSEVDKLKADGKVFNRNELLKVALEYKPTDDKGNIDLEKSYELMEKLKVKDTKKSNARKELADSTVSGTKGESTPKDFKTPEDLKGRSWEDII